jgi:diguanylate cyclase (GGDEF)-like protein
LLAVTQPSAAVRRDLTPIAPWPTVSTLDAYVRAEQVRGVFQQALPAQLLSVAAAGVICYALWGVSDHARLLWWFAILTVATLARMGLSLSFTRLGMGANIMRWEVAFIASLALVSLIWGAGGWIIMPPDSPVHQAVVYFFLMGVAGGAAASYSAHPTASAVSVSALMLPATVGFALGGGAELKAMAVGGVLYLAAALRSTRSVSDMVRRNIQLSFELHQAYGRAKDLARTDELTGLPNRRAFLERGTSALELARRHKRPLALIMFDIDHFKRINDTHGHGAGDAALRAVTSVLSRIARASDTPGRLGGEEFGLLLPETRLDDAVTVAERLRRDVGALTVPFDGTAIRITCSFGVAGLQDDLPGLDALLQSADEALYRAKREGRDRVARR